MSLLRHARRLVPEFRKIIMLRNRAYKRVFVIVFTEIRKIGIVGYDFGESYVVTCLSPFTLYTVPGAAGDGEPGVGHAGVGE